MSDAAGGGADARGRITPAFQPSQAPKRAPCQEGCPNSGDIRGWIGIIAQHARLGLTREEAFDRAWAMVAEVNPFPAVLGRVCPHPCESHCNRADFDGALSINAMERFLGDWGVDQGLSLPRLNAEARSESVGVVGAGPSGLSFAYQMARRGYKVTVYERQPRAGGMLRYGIPDYRLPQDVLDQEIQRIMELGVTLQLNTAVGIDVTMEQLRERHDVLYLGIGAQRGRGLGLPGEDGPGVWSGTDYLERINRGEAVELGERVVVVGGGNTAIDAARTARRSGARVVILYRRSREQMPAFAPEIEEALEEGVDIEFLAAPVELRRDGARLLGLVARRMRLGEPDDSGRRRPVPVEGSDFEVEADAVLAAISQEPAWDGIDGVPLDHGWIVAGEDGAVDPGVWAGGDVLGLGIAGEAIAHGRRAAEAIHRGFQGLTGNIGGDGGPPVSSERILFDFHTSAPPALPTHATPEERLAHPDAEVSRGISAEDVVAEAARCFSCGDCFGCQQCWMFCTPGCFTQVEEARPGVYFTLSLDECAECGKCAEVCPCGYLELS